MPARATLPTVPTCLFFDESGNLDFSPNGSRYYLFGVLSTADPAPLTVALTELRYQMLGEGLELECFHAAEDTQAVRSRVFARITEVGGFELDVLVADKRRMRAELHDPLEFYSCLAPALLDAVLRRHADGGERLVVVTDRLPLQRHRNAAEKSIKSAIRNTLGARPFSVVHHTSAAHALLQVVDYCTWAVQRKWHRGDGRSYELIRPWIRGEYEALGEIGGG
ncbi:MAG TPA: DUF3800 domain-containing protein [Longimicrobium sp.]